MLLALGASIIPHMRHSVPSWPLPLAQTQIAGFSERLVSEIKINSPGLV